MADATLDLATVWDQIRERLATSLSPQQNAMLNLTRPLGLVEDTAVLAAPNEFTQTVLESRMRRVLAEALSEQFGRDIRVAVQLEDAPAGAAGRGPRRASPPVGPGRPPRRSAPRRTGPAGTGPTTAAAPSASAPTPWARAPWDRDPSEELAGRGGSEVRELRPVDGPPARSVDRGAPEDWATTTWGTGADSSAGDRDWGGSGEGRSADVLPFDIDGPGGEQRSRARRRQPRGTGGRPSPAARPGWTRA